MIRLRAVMVMASLVLTSAGALADPAKRPLAEALLVDDVVGSCVDPSALAAQIVGWTGESEIDARISVRVNHDATSSGFQIHHDHEAVGERIFPTTGLSCERATRALALAIAMALDAAVLKQLGVTQGPPSTQPPEIEHAEPITHERRHQPPPPPRANWISIHGGALLLAGVLPKAAFGVEVGIGYRHRAFEIGASVFGSLADNVAIGHGTIDVTLLAGNARGCVMAEHAGVRPMACAGLAVGAMSAQGAGFSPSYDRTTAWVAATARLEVAFAVARWLEIALHIDGLVPLAVPRFDVVDTAGVVVASAPLSPVGGAFGTAIILTF